MFENVLFAAAAVATIAGFILEVWREMKSSKQEDGEGRKEKTSGNWSFLNQNNPRRPPEFTASGFAGASIIATLFRRC